MESYVVDGVILSIVGETVSVRWVPSHIHNYTQGQVVEVDPMLVRLYGRAFGITVSPLGHHES